MLDHPAYRQLITALQRLGSVAVAFSGGVDSSFLLVAAREALGEKVTAFTVDTPYIADWEVDEARELCRQWNIPHRILTAGILPALRDNPPDRCYRCKTHVFATLIAVATEAGLQTVVDGTNFDDTRDYRPGLKALKELKVRSPLLENGITKAQVREFSRQLGLPTWDKPAYACLLTRLPHDTAVTTAGLRRIEAAEKCLMDLGFKAVRVRVHGDLARIEVDPERVAELSAPPLAAQVDRRLKALGFRHVAVDLGGYRMGAFNPASDGRPLEPAEP